MRKVYKLKSGDGSVPFASTSNQHNGGCTCSTRTRRHVVVMVQGGQGSNEGEAIMFQH